MLHDFDHPIECTTWRPIHRDDNKDSICECGLTFFEHRILVRPFPDNHKPWCQSIVEHSTHKCNCNGNIAKSNVKSEIKECIRWRQSSGGNCLCGLPWDMHSLNSRNGYLFLDEYHPVIKASQKSIKDDDISNKELITWLKIIGRSNEARIDKITDILRTANTEVVDGPNRIVLEGILNLLKEYEVFPEILNERPCPMCASDMDADRVAMCKSCENAMLFEADEHIYNANKNLPALIKDTPKLEWDERPGGDDEAFSTEGWTKELEK